VSFKKFNLYPPRFKTSEDGALFLKCCQNKEHFPPEKWIHPVIVIGGKAVENPAYRDAAFQVEYVFDTE
jgi:hypothetical protein